MSYLSWILPDWQRKSLIQSGVLFSNLSANTAMLSSFLSSLYPHHREQLEAVTKQTDEMFLYIWYVDTHTVYAYITQCILSTILLSTSLHPANSLTHTVVMAVTPLSFIRTFPTVSLSVQFLFSPCQNSQISCLSMLFQLSLSPRRCRAI